MGTQTCTDYSPYSLILVFWYTRPPLSRIWMNRIARRTRGDPWHLQFATKFHWLNLKLEVPVSYEILGNLAPCPYLLVAKPGMILSEKLNQKGKGEKKGGPGVTMGREDGQKSAQTVIVAGCLHHCC